MMAVVKDKERGTWRVSTYYKDWTGKQCKKTKRGFKTKHEAQDWEKEFLLNKAGDMNMLFGDFVEIYRSDLKNKVREHTWMAKNNIIDKKILPYFANLKMNEIKPSDVLQWQNELLKHTDSNGKTYSLTYLKTIHNQLSAIFNHAVNMYDLKSNPARKAGVIGKKESEKEMLFWTKEEYLKFSEAMMEKPLSFYAFEILYWCGLRVGELLALTPADFDFERKTIRINKSYQRLKREDVITAPKTDKSVRQVDMPDFLCEEIQDYIHSIYGVENDQRIFPVTKSYLHHEMDRGCAETGVKRIRIHDLRHSHVSLLINMGFDAVTIGNRVGHESIDITFRYAHMFPSTQKDIVKRLNAERREQDVS